MKQKAIFFDRDGTLIEDKVYLNDPDNIVYLPFAFEALARLSKEGFLFFIATNQSGVARGIVQISNLDEIHRRMQNEFQKHGVTFSEFYYAPYAVDSGHPDRKPSAGMLLKGVEKYNLDPSKCWMVGDRMSDVEAGHRAKMKSILLSGVESTESSQFDPPEFIASDLNEAVQYILKSL